MFKLENWNSSSRNFLKNWRFDVFKFSIKRKIAYETYKKDKIFKQNDCFQRYTILFQMILDSLLRTKTDPRWSRKTLRVRKVKRRTRLGFVSTRIVLDPIPSDGMRKSRERIQERSCRSVCYLCPCFARMHTADATHSRTLIGLQRERAHARSAASSLNVIQILSTPLDA